MDEKNQVEPAIGMAEGAGHFSLEVEGTPTPHAEPVSTWTPDGEKPADPPKDASVPDEETVIAAIATVYDPEIPVNIYELGLIYAIDLHDDGSVKVEMTLTAPNCPSAQELPAQVKEAVEKIDTVTTATVEIVWEPPWDMSRMSEDARLALNMF
ncbi:MULTISPECIES: SUF system Fe-S cluster assembly protein [Komagataeibacter]|uniref:SUF system Fe-S cluster assembly protein n=2 Tax=Komagataeibacter TaxID=1434011 RepID=A0A318QVZ2_9PROT|nr:MULTISPECIES: SUF system Fe-S cluster assembly protein [Komagataeibacter]GBR29357.1 metal-sulfur cluster biosynthetic enzyme [Komagataeibacter oboediens DSM 11826]MBL7233784.1 SUF system Fe-S cluster assembly protein [Komagataeibacter oboediens]MBT0674865.1 SUF system Fe-S cluster assembly protein [Komagataeibacter oboediens]MBT0678587.1 SUF system Fe-S cluster assembly protein [Komagataeibacter oboediens]MBV0887646.1 SUF system Fe-S cluster assembly protein [Komagataeibacter oboediens]